jgi:Resolvase, N terminal domain
VEKRRCSGAARVACALRQYFLRSLTRVSGSFQIFGFGMLNFILLLVSSFGFFPLFKEPKPFRFNGSAGRAMSAPMSAFAEFEREMLEVRERAGLAHARQRGERLGRPATATMHTIEVRKLCRSGLSKPEISRRLNTGRTSVSRILVAQTNR